LQRACGLLAAWLLRGSVALAQVDAGTTDTDAPWAPLVPPTDAGVLPTADTPEAPPPDEEPSPEEITAADEALGPDAEPPDPIATEALRTGSTEGPALPTSPRIAVEIAALSDRACLRALARARVPFTRIRAGVPGIVTPVRVTGPIRGVRYVASGTRGVGEVMDCRLGVALARFSTLLRRLRVREVRHYSIFRPASAAQVARRPVQIRHAGGLAVDAATFVRDDGVRFEVLRDYHGRRRRAPCGPSARVPTLPAARFLRTVECEAARRGYFNVILGPTHNREHRNHFHLEVTRGVSWLFVR
jgi:hypothetical protein